ncbi:MAG: DUF839 domain-containing protein [Pseudacidovorax sp.]|uniref:PhoX family protein n=1 Tax=Pseudacidovorax sp. TaxID=1934311 RepID=UPI001B70F752|nr:alkaline phosphatase PhoX [Pseudacidovorax sp.]MBP6893288.1 DUF839 domain-containing protein [Pseudacidovorax sp.]
MTTHDSTLSVPTRRKALKLFGTAPLLPLGGAALLTACGGGSDGNFNFAGVTPSPAPAPAPVPAPAAQYVSTEFSSMPAPSLVKPAEMATTTTNSVMKVAFNDGSSVSYNLAYQPYFISGQMVPDGKGGTVLAGGYYDINNKPIIDSSVAGKERQFFSDCADGSSLLTVPGAKVSGVKGNAVFAVVQFEYTSLAQDRKTDMYGKLPSPIAVLTLDQDPKTGKLSLVKYHNVDTSAAHGLWITCGASLSPWGTHLSSEEYEPDAFTIASNTMFQAYSKNVFGDATKANPYHYGHLPEITVNADGTGSCKKHYCLGRISHELIHVMPDERTALMGDDATNGGLFMFVADKARDLSAGTLYVARYDEVLTDTSTARLTWINLGHATSAEIEALANALVPTDIMDVQTADPADATYTRIMYSGKANWIKVKTNKDKAAAFLETHRYAALKGGSMAFTKMEGTTVNVKDKVAYSALANVQSSMVNGNSAWMSSANVTFPKVLNCGVVLEHKLGGGAKDSSGAAIDSEWVAVSSRVLLTGEDLSTPDSLGNTTNPDKISSADNLKFSEKMRTLFIGEDSGHHVNNFLWAYNVDTKKLSRILSTPAGAESTGLHAVDEINGWTYIMSNFQHPGDWGSIHNVVKGTLEPLIRSNYGDGCAVGYLTADPVQYRLVKG